MPSRLIIAAILAFWLGMTGLLIHHEVVPMMLADASPTYQPDLTDEIGAPLIAWKLIQKGKRAGSATSRIVARGDRSYEFHSTYHFDVALSQLKQIETVYRVGENGKLQSLYMKLVHDLNIYEVRGDVVGHMMTPRIYFNEVEQKLFEMSPIDVNEQGEAVNAMSLIGRLRRLHEGQTWKIPRLDLSRCFSLPFLKDLSGPPSLIAIVKSDTLLWHRHEVPCFKIEYHETGKEVTARTWVRKTDGMVLRQEAVHLGSEMIVERLH